MILWKFKVSTSPSKNEFMLEFAAGAKGMHCSGDYLLCAQHDFESMCLSFLADYEW